jgi:hypothetical protein
MSQQSANFKASAKELDGAIRVELITSVDKSQIFDAIQAAISTFWSANRVVQEHEYHSNRKWIDNSVLVPLELFVE